MIYNITVRVHNKTEFNDIHRFTLDDGQLRRY